MGNRRKFSGVRRGPRKAFRVWITSSGDWHPNDPHDIPPDATVIEPAEERVFSASLAARYVAAFNRAALAGHRRVWAVALPVVVRYEGDLEAGQRLAQETTAEDEEKD
jgi:hypothetical protein